jgi:hypothetical protein
MRIAVHGHDTDGPEGQFGIYRISSTGDEEAEPLEENLTNFTLRVLGRIRSDNVNFMGHHLEVSVRQLPDYKAAVTTVNIFAKDKKTDHILKQALIHAASIFQIDATNFGKVCVPNYCAPASILLKPTGDL